MSDVSTAISLLRTRVASVLTTHAELPHPGFVEENNEQKLDKAYGVQYSDALNTRRYVSKQISVQQNFLVVITRKIRANEYNVSGWQSGFDGLMEDRALVIKAIEGEPTLGDSSVVARATWESDGGPERVFDDSDRYVKLELLVAVEYFESTT